MGASSGMRSSKFVDSGFNNAPRNLSMQIFNELKRRFPQLLPNSHRCLMRIILRRGNVRIYCSLELKIARSQRMFICVFDFRERRGRERGTERDYERRLQKGLVPCRSAGRCVRDGF